jgi:hypothetical protein
MNVAEKICEQARQLPEPLAKEVLAFIERILAKSDSSLDNLKAAQEPSMKRTWDNTEDDIWDEL